MIKYIVKRLLLMIPVLIGITFLFLTQNAVKFCFLKIKKVPKSTNNYSEICDTMESAKYRKYLILSV